MGGSVWARSSIPTKVGAGGVVIVGFALLFFEEYILGNKPGLLGSVFYALAPPVMFAEGILFLSQGLTRIRQEHIAWYKQQLFLQGIAFIFVAFAFLMTAGSINKILPPLLALALGLAFIFVAFVCIIQSILVNQVKRRN